MVSHGSSDTFITCALISVGWDLEMLCTLAHAETRYCIEMKHRLLSKRLIAGNMLDGEKITCASIIFHSGCMGNLFSAIACCPDYKKLFKMPRSHEIACRYASRLTFALKE